MTASIEQTRADVQKAFAALLAAADDPRSRSLFGFERETWTLLLSLGRALALLFLAHQVARSRATWYRHGGRWYALKGECRETPLGTRFGKVLFSRPIGRPLDAPEGRADLLVDRELGLCSGFSLGVVLQTVRLAAQMSFENARKTHYDIYEWAPSAKAILRMVDGLGDRARPFLEQAPAPEGDGEILVIQADGGGAAMLSHIEYEKRCRPHAKKGRGSKRKQRKEQRQSNPRPRRKKGKSKNAKLAVAAVIYTLERTPDGLEGPINKRLLGTFDSHEELFVWALLEAKKRGYGEKRTLFLADGSDHIWRLQQAYFPLAECCLDWFHLAEYLWKAGRSFHREGSKALRKWVDAQKTRLRAGEIAAVIKEMEERFSKIPKTGPGNKGRRERLATTIGYVTKHQSRMPYAKFLAEDLDIGSGAIEGAIRNLIRMRLDGPMRWGRGRSELVLHLRCILLNGQWDDFAHYAAGGDGVHLPAQPIPAQPHAARAKAA